MPISDDDRVRLPALTALYNEQCAHGRHTEAQRATLTTILLTVAGGLVALIGNLKFSPPCVAIAVTIIAIGFLGKCFVAIYEKKWDEGGKRRDFYRGEMERIGSFTPPPSPTSTGQLRKLWQHAFSGVIVFGIVCLLLTVAVWRMRSGKGESTLQQLTNTTKPSSVN